MSPSNLSRRDFLLRTGVAAAGLGLAACDSGSGMEDPPPTPGDPTPGDPSPTGIQISGNRITIDTTIGSGRELAVSGGFLLVSAVRTAVINVGGEIKAFTSVCTHQQCDVSSFNGSTIRCPCHGSRFDTNGNAVQGPATSPLQEFDVSVDGTIVTVTR